jgi:hypothetical protein
MRTRYFVRRDNDESPTYVFRIHFDPGPRVELFDVGAHAWRPRPLEPLYRWAGFIDGEIGVDAISVDEATRIIAALEFGPAAGRRRGPDRLRPERVGVVSR